MDYDQFRKLAIIALFADDDLMENLVLKGGVALSLLYSLDHRSSIDIDASLIGDLPWTIEETKRKLVTAFTKVFSANGFEVFDAKLHPKPRKLREGQDIRFSSGYQFEFKVIEKSRSTHFDQRASRKAVEATVIGPNNQIKFQVDISTFEYIHNPHEIEIDGYIVYAYSPELIGVEKLRAICQQMPDYQYRISKTPRSRDFFDIYNIAVKRKVDFLEPKVLELIPNVFNAKGVTLESLARISETYDLHVQDFSALKVIVPAGVELKEFRFYFNFVTKLALDIFDRLN